MILNIILLILMVIFTSIGQIIFKLGVKKINFTKDIILFLKSLINIHIILGTVFFLIAPIFYILALRYLKLSFAFSFTAFNYILIFLGGWLFLKEKATKYHFIGTFLIFLGVIIFNLNF